MDARFRVGAEALTSTITERLRGVAWSDAAALLGPRLVRQISALVAPERVRELSSGPEGGGRLLEAYFGDGLLLERRVRTLLLERLQTEDLRRLAEEYAGRSYRESADNALLLSSLPFRRGGGWSRAFLDLIGISTGDVFATEAALPPEETVEPVVTLPELHPFQTEVRDRLFAVMREPRARALVQLPTGSGKTRTAVEAAVVACLEGHWFEEGRTVVWLAHSEELLEQAIDTIRDVWQQRAPMAARIVRAWGDYLPLEYSWKGAFVVGGFQKMARLLGDGALPCRPALVLVDEAHRALAPTFRTAVEGCAGEAASIVGLSATPGRSLGASAAKENAELARLFGGRLIGFDPPSGRSPIAELRNLQILARIERVAVTGERGVMLSDSDACAAQRDGDLPGGVLERLARSRPRNQTILNAIRSEVAQRRPVLAFSCGIDHSRLLSTTLNLEGIRAAHVDCHMARSLRHRATSGFRAGEFDVLLNFGVLSTGFDAPRTRAVVIARPTSSVVLYSQMLGRGLRGPAMGGGEVCRLIDVVDNFVAFGDVESVYASFDEYWS